MNYECVIFNQLIEFSSICSYRIMLPILLPINRSTVTERKRAPEIRTVCVVAVYKFSYVLNNNNSYKNRIWNVVSLPMDLIDFLA